MRQGWTGSGQGWAWLETNERTMGHGFTKRNIHCICRDTRRIVLFLFSFGLSFFYSLYFMPRCLSFLFFPRLLACFTALLSTYSFDMAGWRITRCRLGVGSLQAGKPKLSGVGGGHGDRRWW